MRKDEILVEDYKVVLKRVHEAEKVVSNWERTFLLVNGVIFGLFVQILLSDYCMKKLVIYFCSIVGIVISLIWFLLQVRGYRYSRIREYRMGHIEALIRKLKPNYLTFAWDMEVENYKWEKKIWLWEMVSTYALRNIFPLLIILFWVLLAIANHRIVF